MNYAYAGQDAKMAPKNSKEVNVMMQADRIPPANVSPIIIEGIRYEVIHWGKDWGLWQNGGYISAIEMASGKELWVLKIYDVTYDPGMEKDVQDIFIKSMSKPFFSKKLKIVDEKGRKFIVDITNRSVRQE